MSLVLTPPKGTEKPAIEPVVTVIPTVTVHRQGIGFSVVFGPELFTMKDLHVLQRYLKSAFKAKQKGQVQNILKKQEISHAS